MAGAISQPRQSCQFLFCLMKNPLLYRSAWPENSERFLMKAARGAVLQVDVEDPFEQSGPTHARCLPLRVSVLAEGLGGALCGAGLPARDPWHQHQGRAPTARGKQGGGQARDAPADDEGVKRVRHALAHRPTATAVLGGKMALTLQELKM